MEKFAVLKLLQPGHPLAVVDLASYLWGFLAEPTHHSSNTFFGRGGPIVPQGPKGCRGGLLSFHEEGGRKMREPLTIDLQSPFFHVQKT
jgi:hypothetical protein